MEDVIFILRIEMDREEDILEGVMHAVNFELLKLLLQHLDFS